MNPLVSIIVPIYNSADYLDKCLKSIINQTYNNIEIILVNDGSTDNSRNICEVWASKDYRIKVINQRNKGLSGARNSGLDIAKGEFITFVDSDDFIENDAIEVLVEYAEIDSISCYGMIMVDCQSKKRFIRKSKKYYEFNTREFLKYYLLEFANWGNLKKDDYYIGSSMNNKLFSANIFRKLRFNENERISEDVDLMVDIILKSRKIKLLPCAKYYYVHQNDESITNKKFDKSLLKVIEIHKRIENKMRSFEYSYLKLAEMGTLYTCVYIVNKFARLTDIERNNNISSLDYILQEIKNRKNVIKYIGIIGKLKLYMIVFGNKIYIDIVRFFRVKLKL